MTAANCVTYTVAGVIKYMIYSSCVAATICVANCIAYVIVFMIGALSCSGNGNTAPVATSVSILIRMIRDCSYVTAT